MLECHAGRVSPSVLSTLVHFIKNNVYKMKINFFWTHGNIQYIITMTLISTVYGKRLRCESQGNIFFSDLETNFLLYYDLQYIVIKYFIWNPIEVAVHYFNEKIGTRTKTRSLRSFCFIMGISSYFRALYSITAF